MACGPFATQPERTDTLEVICRIIFAPSPYATSFCYSGMRSRIATARVMLTIQPERFAIKVMTKSLVRFLLCGTIMSVCLKVFASEPPTVTQVFRAGEGAHEGQGIAIAANGNIIATGQFAGTATFGATTLTNGGSFDHFLAAYSPNGQTLWAKGAGAAGADFGQKVIVDKEGNIVVAGVIQGPVNFHGTTLIGFGNQDWFLAKYSSSGELIWVRLAGGSENDQASDVAQDGAGNYFVSGRVNGPANFGGITVGVDRQTRCVLVKYDKDGTVIWVRDVAGTDSTAGSGVIADASGNSFVTSLIKTGGSGPFLAKYDPAGTQQWIYITGTGITFFEEGSSVDFDGAGNLYVAGRFSAASITFGTSTLSNPKGSPTGFIAKFDSGGVPVWGIKAGARAFDLDVQADGTIYATGFYNTNGRTIGNETPVADAGSLEVFMAKVSTAGELLWMKPSAEFGGGPSRAVAHTANGSTFAIGESSAELFDFGTFRGGVFIAELKETVVNAPSLSIGIIEKKLRISWPAEFSGYSLETTASIENPFSEPTIQLEPVPKVAILR